MGTTTPKETKIGAITPMDKEEFNSKLKEFIVQFEGGKDGKLIYDTATGSPNPTIGYGFNLRDDVMRKTVFKAMDIPTEKWDDLTKAINDKNITKAATLKTTLEGIMGPGANFSMNETQMDKVYNKTAETYVESARAKSGDLPDSPELIALTSAEWNGVFGKGLQNAFTLTDPVEARAEAWYQLRYVHAAQNIERRFSEAEYFGLYNDPNPDKTTASTAYNYLLSHIDTPVCDVTGMREYDIKYGGKIAAANADLSKIESDLEIGLLREEIIPGYKENDRAYGGGDTGNYYVKSGDTVGNLAKLFHMSVDDFKKLNNIGSDNKIKIGQELRTRPPSENDDADASPAPEQTDDDFQQFDKYFDNATTYYQDNNPNLFTIYPDGKIVESLALASLESGTTTNNVQNADNLPQTREELLSQLLDLGMPVEDAEALVAKSSLPAADEDAAGADSGAVTDEEAAMAHQQEVDQAAQLRAAELGAMQSLNNLGDAIEAGDGVGAAKAGLDSYANFAAYQTALHPEADNSSLISNQAAATALSSAIGLGQAMDSGDGLAIAGSGVALLHNIDNYLDTQNNEYGNFIDEKGSAALGIAAAGIGLAESIDSGDGLAIAQSSVGLLQGIDRYAGGFAEFDEMAGFDSGTAGAVVQFMQGYSPFTGTEDMWDVLLYPASIDVFADPREVPLFMSENWADLGDKQDLN